MDRQEQLKFCKKCKNKKFNPKKGIVCGLTNEYPAFENECNDFVIDYELQEKEEQRQKDQQAENKESGDIKKLAIFLFGILLLEAVLIYFFNDIRNTKPIILKLWAFLLFGFMFSSAYFRLTYFDWRFKRMIRAFGYEKARKIVFITSFIFLIGLLFIRNF